MHLLLLLPLPLPLPKAKPPWLPTTLVIALFLCFYDLGTTVVSASVVTHLPGFHGRLPFHLETGYVSVDDVMGVELFYYLIESERRPSEDPVLLWLTGGPGCSAFSGLAFEIGPLKFVRAKYNGSVPNLVYFPHSWTKIANIIFLDSPVGTGFSFSASPEGYDVGDISSSMHVYHFIIKWFIDHPQFLSNPFYVAGDSYAGKVIPVITQIISQGIEYGKQPILNLKGYLVGNPVTGEKIDKNFRVPYAHGVGIISDQIYELAQKHCEGEDYEEPRSAPCAEVLDIVKKHASKVALASILEPVCPEDTPKPKDAAERRSLKADYKHLLQPSETPPPFKCRSYVYWLSYYWANNNSTQEALHVKKGTVEEWQRCNRDISYTQDLPSSIKYHYNLTSRGYRALVYSGDHDLGVPFLGTEAWIRYLNFPIVDDWRSWNFGDQSAGFTITYSNNMTFATVKGAGHTAPEYRPKECLAMVHRWLSHKPL
ncbi:serine carboxypeptidase-like 7 isoform X2 [Typha latifolia]|uniref:serine carboxypeptidase-like 7 isoform X2 n=1 Tax=Typha latifolia TaxID=4733 RepID=UPI003C2F85DF